ncbi:cysteine--tRNA ligase [Suicoccus acidiformans]|uniref:Cysteine--tRNA ligase n=1 Tax=Suicoccus acidiformans TaxID=2036206 RepID=A0A347WNK2_9LACT|nr:cysteine--tRNA ligase [Suicoccus acidiformans]AXY26659.1 cysteine--tRNA ligase [Suicoccus acidiformans]
MAIQIYNTLSRTKETFQPIEHGKVKMYVCGPTVYNYIHIGNARSTVAFDTIRKYLEYRGYEVNYVSNFTDVDDKIIKAAKEEDLTTEALADKYIEAFFEDTGALNVKRATVHPRVKDNIPEIITFIESLIEKGHAYVSDGDVYFRTESFESYGELSQQSLEDLMAGASLRTEIEETQRKENPVDFALWKAVKTDDEISWNSPWGAGRPGWHIECSVMSTKYLGETLDIHGGGQDLEFPHHENEIAQSECHTGHKFSNYWMHNGFVTFGQDEEKMSKSLGNFVLLRELLQEVDPVVVRYLLASVHYRKPLRYDQKALDEAKTQINRIKEVLRRLQKRQEQSDGLSEVDSNELNHYLERIQTFENDFKAAMDDDFNAANGLTVIFDFIKFINIYLTQEHVALQIIQVMQASLKELLYIFGIEIKNEDDLLDNDIQAMIDERNEARANRDFARADAIRDALKAQGISLDDTPQGTLWKRDA